jgi:hypothetical protein
VAEDLAKIAVSQEMPLKMRYHRLNSSLVLSLHPNLNLKADARVSWPKKICLIKNLERKCKSSAEPRRQMV